MTRINGPLVAIALAAFALLPHGRAAAAADPSATLPPRVLSVLQDYGWSYQPTLIPHRAHSSQRCVDPVLHQLIAHYSAHFDIDENFVYALIFQESRCSVTAISHAGAVGLMQLMPQWGAVDAMEWLTGVKLSRVDPALLRDPHLNVLLGTAYIRMLVNTFADVEDGEPRQRLVLAAYNWGPTRVRDRMSRMKRTGDPVRDARDWTANIPVHETRDYVTRVVLYHHYLSIARRPG